MRESVHCFTGQLAAILSRENPLTINSKDTISPITPLLLPAAGSFPIGF